MPALSELRRKKLSRLFAIYDADHNGYIERADFERLGAFFATVNGFAPDSAEAAAMRAQNQADWKKMEQAADSDRDGRVGLEEFLAYSAEMDDMSEVANRTAGMIVAMMDRDRDGKVSRQEYVAGAPPEVGQAHSAAMFAKLDRDGDGYLTSGEVLGAVQELMLGEDPNAPGNELLGPLG
jgi:Ca2+-binding EF-hand superfamily protein